MYTLWHTITKTLNDLHECLGNYDKTKSTFKGYILHDSSFFFFFLGGGTGALYLLGRHLTT
jgi:hypothetical protein